MHLCVKSLGVTPGLANARPLSSTKFANTSPLGITRRANAPQLSGECMGALGIDGCIMTEPRDLSKQWKIKDHFQSLSANSKKCHSFL